MHTESIRHFEHDHVFGQDAPRAGERRTLLVIALTASMMLIEILAGLAFGSMALLADGLHMSSHAVALGITALAYRYAREHAADTSFTFGTGKVNSLAGFTGALLLGVFAFVMAWESIGRLANPIPIAFNQAIGVAVLGLLVNGVSVFLLESDDHHHDHNLRSAYLHVLADALTSLLAIAALLTGKYLGLVWMDPLMGIVGAPLVARWSWNLLHQSGAVLLDRRAPEVLVRSMREAVESADDNRVTDLHVWSIGPGIYAAIIAVVTHEPQPVDTYRELLPSDLGLAHTTVEVVRCS